MAESNDIVEEERHMMRQHELQRWGMELDSSLTVVSVAPDSPAHLCGMAPGMQVRRIDGRACLDSPAAAEMLRSSALCIRLSVRVKQKATWHDVILRRSDIRSPWGVEVRTVSLPTSIEGGDRRTKIIISKITPDSKAAKCCALKVGQQVLRINAVSPTATTANQMLSDSDRSIVLRVTNDCIAKDVETLNSGETTRLDALRALQQRIRAVTEGNDVIESTCISLSSKDWNATVSAACAIGESHDERLKGKIVCRINGKAVFNSSELRGVVGANPACELLSLSLLPVLAPSKPSLDMDFGISRSTFSVKFRRSSVSKPWPVNVFYQPTAGTLRIKAIKDDMSFRFARASVINGVAVPEYVKEDEAQKYLQIVRDTDELSVTCARASQYHCYYHLERRSGLEAWGLVVSPMGGVRSVPDTPAARAGICSGQLVAVNGAVSGMEAVLDDSSVLLLHVTVKISFLSTDIQEEIRSIAASGSHPKPVEASAVSSAPPEQENKASSSNESPADLLMVECSNALSLPLGAPFARCVATLKRVWQVVADYEATSEIIVAAATSARLFAALDNLKRVASDHRIMCSHPQAKKLLQCIAFALRIASRIDRASPSGRSGRYADRQRIREVQQLFYSLRDSSVVESAQNGRGQSGQLRAAWEGRRVRGSPEVSPNGAVRAFHCAARNMHPSCFPLERAGGWMSCGVAVLRKVAQPLCIHLLQLKRLTMLFR